MRINTWIKVAGFALLLGGCSSGDDSPPPAGGGGGSASADAFTNSVFQVAKGSSDAEEPSDQLAQLTPLTPENAEPANL